MRERLVEGMWNCCILGELVDICGEGLGLSPSVWYVTVAALKMGKVIGSHNRSEFGDPFSVFLGA
jgi:hypothetical protein